MAEQQRVTSYGQSSNLFIMRKETGDSLIIGGVAQDSGQWTRVLARKAAQMIWFHLTKLLYPEKSDMVTALVSTAPLRATHRPTITTHATVGKASTGGHKKFDLTGWSGNDIWTANLTEYEARRLWTVIDMALFPTGWQQIPVAEDSSAKSN